MQRELTVTQLNKYIEGVFEDELVLQDICIVGEVYEYKHTDNYTFLVLKDGECTLSCIAFFVAQNLKEGALVKLKGSVRFYRKSGKVSFVVKEVVPVGEGNLYKEFALLLNKLKEEGLFENRPPLPEVIKKAAIVTSEHGAVLHDILSVVKAKNPLLNICVYDVRVQGQASEDTIADAVVLLNQFASELDLDVIIIARGGGSATDLQAYNTEKVARAVASSRVPIVSAVGHETDYTLCDLCASVRAGTPSIAADIVCIPVVEKVNYIRALGARLKSYLQDMFVNAAYGVVYSSSKLVRHCELLMSDKRHYIANLLRNISSKCSELVAAKSEKLAAVSTALDNCSPLKVLSRGYAKVVKDGKNIGSAKELNKGDSVRIVMSDGKVDAKIL